MRTCVPVCMCVCVFVCLTSCYGLWSNKSYSFTTLHNLCNYSPFAPTLIASAATSKIFPLGNRRLLLATDLLAMTAIAKWCLDSDNFI